MNSYDFRTLDFVNLALNLWVCAVCECNLAWVRISNTLWSGCESWL